MTELRDAKNSQQADPLHNLYRMSRTAGLGSADYVAINNTAILTLILGLLSILALLYPIMILVAAAAVVCGVVAMVQIRSSNGTQTGRGFAALGILLALGFGGTAGGRILMNRLDEGTETRQIAELIKNLNDLLVAGEYAKAYDAMFSENFKKDFSEQAFTSTWERFSITAGKVQSVEFGGRAEFEPKSESGVRRAVASSRMKFEKIETAATPIIHFVKNGDEWEIEQIGEIFTKPRGGRTGGAGDAPQEFDPSQPMGPMPVSPPQPARRIPELSNP